MDSEPNGTVHPLPLPPPPTDEEATPSKRVAFLVGYVALWIGPLLALLLTIAFVGYLLALGLRGIVRWLSR